MIQGISKIVQQNLALKLGKGIRQAAINKRGLLLQNQQIINCLFAKPKYTFARNIKSNSSIEQQSDSYFTLDEQEQQQEQSQSQQPLKFEETDGFKYTAETFNQILKALDVKGKALVEVIRLSNLKEQVMNNQPQDKDAFINCLKVLDKCDILDNDLRERLYEQLKQSELYNATYSNSEIGVIVQYFMMKSQKKQYQVELEKFLIQRVGQMEENHIRQIIQLYCDNFKGSTEFYQTIQEKLLSLIEEGNKMNKEAIPFNVLMNNYLSCFTKSNYFTQSMEQYLIKQIEEKLLPQEYQDYFKETLLPFAPQILYFFALQFNSTKHLHDTLLHLIQFHHEKDRKLPFLSKPLNIFLRVYQLFSDKQINSFFLPAMRYKNKNIMTSVPQKEIGPYLLKFIPKLHLKENESIENFNVDFYTEMDNIKLVIEINGRFHYYHNRYAAIYEIKRRCLQKQGYQIIEIKDYDWKSLEDNQKLSFIANQLSPYIKSAENFLQKNKQINQ